MGPYNNAVLVVTMPNGTKITDFKWLSVWCRRFAVSTFNISTILIQWLIRVGATQRRTRVRNRGIKQQSKLPLKYV